MFAAAAQDAQRRRRVFFNGNLIHAKMMTWFSLEVFPMIFQFAHMCQNSWIFKWKVVNFSQLLAMLCISLKAATVWEGILHFWWKRDANCRRHVYNTKEICFDKKILLSWQCITRRICIRHGNAGKHHHLAAQSPFAALMVDAPSMLSHSCS